MTIQYRSLVTQTDPASPDDAVHHFTAKLAVETDPSDVAFDLAHGAGTFALVDARSADAFTDLHLPGAMSLPHGHIDATTAAPLRDGERPWCTAGRRAATPPTRPPASSPRSGSASR